MGEQNSNHAEWLIPKNPGGLFMCSACNAVAARQTRYCHKCGAMMDNAITSEPPTAHESRRMNELETARAELKDAKARISKLEADADEYRQLLHDRENALSMYREESEKRLYEIMNLRGKVEVFEKVLACVKAFSGGDDA